MDEWIQDDAPEDYAHPVKHGVLEPARPKRRGGKRGTNGNRREQARRYWLRHKARRLLYLRIYMRSYRARKRIAAHS